MWLAPAVVVQGQRCEDQRHGAGSGDGAGNRQAVQIKTERVKKFLGEFDALADAHIGGADDGKRSINTFIVYSGATRNTAEKLAGVQIADIEIVLMNLRKPIDGCKPTAIYISKYPALNKRITAEVFRFTPYIYDMKWYKDAEKAIVKNEPVVDEHTRQRQADLEAIMNGDLTDEEKSAVSVEPDSKQEQVVKPSEQEQIKPKNTIKLHLNSSDDLDDLIFGGK